MHYLTIVQENIDFCSIARGSSMGMRFAALETLWLDDNKLTDQTTFSTLAGLRRSAYIHSLTICCVYMLQQILERKPKV